MGYPGKKRHRLCWHEPNLIGRFFSLGVLAGLALFFVSNSCLSGQIEKTIREYALTSGNDFPQRDPQDWQLLGSNDGGKTWVTLDARQNEIFQDRQQRNLYKIQHPGAFNVYRLEIIKVRDPEEVNSIQLAEIELMGVDENDRDPTPTLNDAISAQGDNPPAETVANLFDGRVETKWLDWPTNVATRSSWIQWEYKSTSQIILTNIGQLLSSRHEADARHQVRIKAVVVGQLQNLKKTCFVDRTGCVELGGIDGAENLKASQQVLISGLVEWNGQGIALKKGQVQPLSPANALEPMEIYPGQPIALGSDLKLAEVNGEIAYRRLTANEFAFDLQDEGQSLRIHLRCPNNSQSLPPDGTKISIRGICQGAFNERGNWVAAALWAADWSSLHQLDSKLIDKSPAAKSSMKLATTNSLMTIGQIRKMTDEQINAHPQVQIRGIVTGLLGGFVQDETAGIEVAFPASESRKLTKLGAYIKIDGSVELADGGNLMITAEHVEVLGQGKLPPPQKLSLNQLLTGHMDGEWVEIEGVVRSTDGSHLLIMCEGGELTATLEMATTGLVDGLVDAEVRVRGVAVTAMDAQERVQGIHLLIPSPDHLDIVKPPTDPALLPVRTIGSLLGLSAARESFHRVKIEGTVTLEENHKIFLQDGSGSAMAVFKEEVVLDPKFGRSRWLYWRTSRFGAPRTPDQKLFPGERVQIVGFPETHRYSPVLTEVTASSTGNQQSLTPLPLTADGIEEGGLDSTLVTLEGVLRAENTVGANTILALEWQDRALQVLVPADQNDLLKFDLGSRLRVTGVCQIDPAPYAELGLGIGGVRIQTRSAGDLILLERPPWWTIRRALMLICVMALVVLVILVWVKELSRKVEERSAQLAKEIQLRERTEHHHALEQERSRIAKDLHDDLGANLTQIIFLSERVEDTQQNSADATRWFNLIPATARRTIQSLDEIVWAINPQNDSLESLANYLSQFAQEHLNLARIRCVLEVPLVLPSMSLGAEIRHNLLLATREALQNAATHAAATEVKLTLKLDKAGLHIAVVDNGKGFDQKSVVADSNGLNNIRSRLKEIGGQLEISSHIGKGTAVRMFVSQKALDVRVTGGNNK